MPGCTRLFLSSTILVSVISLISSCTTDDPTNPVELSGTGTPLVTRVMLATPVTPVKVDKPVTIERATTSSPAAPSTQSDHVFIRLSDPLDEPEYYCLDVPGAGRGVRLDSPLQAHTCKPVAEAADELFIINHPSDRHIYMPASDLCLAASRPDAGAILRLQSCAETNLQRFVYNMEGFILRAEQEPLCLMVDPGPGIPTGGPSHLRRDVRLEDCKEIDPTLAQWLLSEPSS